MPYPVSPEYNEKMQALERRVLAKAVIDYTDPFLDQSIQVAVNEEANVSYPAQVADSLAEPFGKIASLDGSCKLDGTYHLAPRDAEEAATHQMGWWGKQLAGAGGAFSAPYPTLTVTHEPRPVHTLRVTGDSKREEWPVDFTIDLYAADDTLLRTESVTGNNQVAWSMTLPTPVLDVAKQVLTITRWSHEGRQVKILEFFTSIQETYLADDLMSFHLLEESEVSQASIPIGNISANEVRLALSNKTRKFDIDNDQSPLKGLLKVNRKVRLWLGADAENLESERPASFTRNSTAYNPEDGSQVAVNEPRYVDGPFSGSKALLVEEGTTNLLTNPKLLNNGQDWTPKSSTAWVDSSGEYPYIHCEAQWDGVYQTLSLSATTYTLTYLVKHKSGFNRIGSHFDGTPTTMKIRVDGGEWIDGDIITVPSDDNWHLVEIQATYTTAGSYRVYLQPGRGVVGVSEFWFKYAQLEQKPYATSLIDGTRSAETLTIPTAGVLSAQCGEVAILRRMDIASNNPPSGVHRNIFSLAGVKWGIFVPNGGANQIRWAVGDWTSQVIVYLTWDAGDWLFIFAEWDLPNATLHVYNVTKGTHASATITNAVSVTVPSSAYVGCADGAHFNAHCNGPIDDLRISSRARTDEEIAAAYASGQPLPVDKWTTLKLSFDGTLDSYRGRPGPAWVPLGTFWTLDDWDSPDDELQATVTARDRLELLRKDTYRSSQVLTNVSLGALAEIVLQDAGLAPSEYHIDTALYSVIVPYAWFQPVSHREALRLIAEAGLAVVYCDRLGVVRMEAFGSVGEEVAMDFASRRDYFRTRTPVRPSQVINEVIVTTQPLRPATSPEEVYRSNQPISIAAGQTVAVTVHYNAPPVIETVASLESPPSGVSIVGAEYYAWGAEVEIHNTSGATQQVTLVISGKPLSVMNRERAIARDEQSIIENAVLRYEFPANHLIQSLTQAQTIADTILASAKDPRRDIEIDWRGNPALLLRDRIRVKGADYRVTANDIEWAGFLRQTTTGRRVV